MPTLGSVKTTVQDIVDVVRTYPDVAPIVPAGGFSTKTALAFANDTMQRFLAEGLDWKWNRGYIPPILTVALQQDYCTAITDASWLEQGWCIDINNNTNNGNRAPKPVFSAETVRDLGQTSYQGKPFNYSLIPNSLAFMGLWQPQTAYSCAYGQPMTPITPIQQFVDANGNILYIDSTVLNLNYNSPGFTGTPITLPPNAPYGVSGTTQPLLPADTPPGTTVQDGTVVWTVADPNAFAVRLAPLPALSGLAWLLYPVYQKLPPFFTSLSQSIDPIPQNLIYLFRQGFRAFAMGHGNAKQFNQAYAQWEEDLQAALRSGDREGEDCFMYPSEGIMGSAYRSGMPVGPGWPYTYYP